jgi:O-antigen/teichoic acid export membrane protein
VKNFAWLTIGEIITRIVGFIVIIWIARHFTPAIYGQWSWAMGFTTILAVLPEFGFSTLIVRELARSKEKTAQFIDNAILIKIILSLITFGLIALIIHFLGKSPEEIKLVYYLGIFAIVNTFATFFQAIFRANERMHYETIARIVQGLVLLSLVIFFIIYNGSILAISYAYIIGAIAGVIFSIFCIWKYFSRFLLGISYKICKELIIQTWPFALSSIAIIIYYNIGLVFLGVYRSDEEVGYYNAAYNIINICTTGMGLLLMAIFPTLSNSFKHAPDRFKILVQDFFKFIYLCSLPFIILIFFNAQIVIRLLYGSQFVESSSVILQILLGSIFILCNYAIFGLGLSASDQQKYYLRGVILGAIFNSLINIFLIPKFGVFGAAGTAIFTELIVGSYMSYKFIKSQSIKLPFTFIVKVTFSSVIMILSIALLSKIGIIILPSLIGLIVFAFILLILKTFQNNPFLFLKNIFFKKNE